MEIKERMLVAIIGGGWAQCNPIGTVMKSEERRGPKRFLVKNQKGTHLSVKQDHMFALAENCNPIAITADELNEKLPEIIKSLAVMVRDLQKQVSRLRSDFDSNLKTLVKTREQLNEHIIKQHAG